MSSPHHEDCIAEQSVNRLQLSRTHHRLSCVGLDLIVSQENVAGLLIDQHPEIAARFVGVTPYLVFRERLWRKPRRALGETRTRRGSGFGILKFPQAIPTEQLVT